MFRRNTEVMIKKLLKLFPKSKSKTYDLGKLQKSGYIETLEDLSGCPNCKSKNITWKFFIPTDGSKPTIPSQSVCNDCGYKDEKGQFEMTNKSILREKKINKILDELQ
jgi:predicted Zn-ribbon and HTH transcriptional regulator